MSHVIEMLGIRKEFPGIVANDNINLQVEEGEIHAILGENGAGKSTLMSILFGLYQADKGIIKVRGKEVSIKNPNDAFDLGIGMVHQHFQLVHNFTVAENIILGKDSKHVDIINRARLRIRESLEDTLTIQDLAQELGVSYSSFRKLFKEYTGFAPALYQQTLKLQRAKELLSTTNESIKEIAYRLNFESPDYFSAKFKNQTGMKPSDFRNTTR